MYNSVAWPPDVFITRKRKLEPSDASVVIMLKDLYGVKLIGWFLNILKPRDDVVD